eukprot:9073909-Pyramimonas_sp.AAC.1
MQKCIKRAELLSERSSYANARREICFFKIHGQISFKFSENHPKVLRLGRLNWAPAVNRQPWLPPGNS